MSLMETELKYKLSYRPYGGNEHSMKNGTNEYEVIMKELYDLKVNGRRKVSERIRIARSFGDLSDNPAYDAAKDEQRRIESRIDELENRRVHY